MLPAHVTSVDIGDGLLAVETVGNGSPVVLVSGLDGRAQFWHRQVPALSARHRVVTFDQRGCGRSTHSQIRYSVTQMAEDLVSLLEALTIERAAFVGHGLGCAVLMELATRHRSGVAALVLLAPWAAPFPQLEAMLATREQVLRSRGADDYVRLEATESLPATASVPTHVPSDAFFRDRAACIKDVDVEASRLHAARDFNAQPRLPSLRVPAWVFAAADDRVIPYPESQQVARALPSACLDAFDSGGHYHPLTNAERVTRSLLDLLDA